MLLERLVTTARSHARSDFKRNPICRRIAVTMTEGNGTRRRVYPQAASVLNGLLERIEALRYD
jgi:hypothetical protein